MATVSSINALSDESAEFLNSAPGPVERTVAAGGRLRGALDEPFALRLATCRSWLRRNVLSTQIVGPLAVIALASTLFMMPAPNRAVETAFDGGAVLALFIGLWLFRAVPDYVAALLFFAMVPALGLATPTIVFSGFMSGGLWLALAGFIIGAAIGRTGLARRLAACILSTTKGSYPRLVMASVLVGGLLCFIAPSAVARIFMLLPVMTALADELGFEHGSNGRSGLILAASIGTVVPSFTILPSIIANLIMAGTAERLYGISFTYAGYFLANFPVLGGLTTLALPFVICLSLPDRARSAYRPARRQTLSGSERTLLVILLTVLGVWLLDFWHGISPAWVALAGAAFCVAPRFGPAREIPLSECVNVAIWLFIAAMMGAGAMISHTGFGLIVANEMIDFVGLEAGRDAFNYAALIAIGMGVTLLGTVLGAPAIMTPLAQMLADATGLPLETVVLLQVPSWMFFPFPYQFPALVAVMAIGGVAMRQVLKVLLGFMLFGVAVAIPLQYLWLVHLGIL